MCPIELKCWPEDLGVSDDDNGGGGAKSCGEIVGEAQRKIRGVLMQPLKSKQVSFYLRFICCCWKQIHQLDFCLFEDDVRFPTHSTKRNDLLSTRDRRRRRVYVAASLLNDESRTVVRSRVELCSASWFKSCGKVDVVPSYEFLRRCCVGVKRWSGLGYILH